jgi:putative lipoic acid-binding regulatory protein
MEKKKQEIQFPCRWEFRLIAAAETIEKTEAEAEAIGKAENAGFEISAGESSGSGKYSALRIACEVDSLERARSLAALLSKVEGVRFLI